MKEIYLYPLGGISKFYMDLNIESYKEFFVLMGGPLFQQLAFWILIFLFPNKKDLIHYYHYHILVFNLLPILPLDGGKISCLLLEQIFPYRFSKIIMIIISYSFILFIFIKNLVISNCIACLFLLVLVIEETKKIPITYHYFLLERYLKHFSFQKRAIIHSENHFWRDAYHIIEKDGNYYLEENYLKKKYDKS